MILRRPDAAMPSPTPRARWRPASWSAFPTETVYGLGADAGSDAAVASIFAAKGRPARPSADRACGRPDPGGAGVAHFASQRAGLRAAADARLLARPADADPAAPRRRRRRRGRRPGHRSACAARRTRWRRRCCVACARSWACTAWPARAPTASAASARPRPRMCSDEFGDDAADARRRRLRGRHRIHHRRLHAAARRCCCAPACSRARRSKRPAASSCAPKKSCRTRAPTPRASGTLEAHYAPNAKVRLMDARALQTALDLLGAERRARIAVYSRTHRAQPLAARGAAAHARRRRAPRRSSCSPCCAISMRRASSLIWVETAARHARLGRRARPAAARRRRLSAAAPDALYQTDIRPR